MDLSELYRDIVESSPDGLWVIDLEGRTLYANPEIARMHRIGAEGLAALTVFDTLDEVGGAQFRAHLEDVRAGRLHERPVEVQWVRSDGTIVWVLCSEVALRDEEGRTRALLHRYAVLREALLRVLTGEGVPDPAVQHHVDAPSKGRVLVVEDNPVNRMVATGLLEVLGYTTDTAEDGLAAIDAARGGDFDAILMDVHLPHVDGYTATRQIRAHENGRRRPIIAMTAAAVGGERERCLEAGMDDFLTKPVDATRLAETLDRWLTRPPAYAARLDLDRLDELRTLDDPGDGSSYVDRAIGNFITNAEAQVATMSAAAAAGDTDQLRAVTHRLAGAALNLGVTALGEAARAIEEQVAEGHLADAAAAIPALAERLVGDLAALRAYRLEHFPAAASS